LSTEDEECSGRQTQVTNPENVNTILSMILHNQRLSAKKIAEILEIPQERVDYIIHKILDMRKLSAKWVPKCLNAIADVIECLLHKPFWTDIGRGLWNFLTVL
jgi:predicted XRE-type DNA-binding protein